MTTETRRWLAKIFSLIVIIAGLAVIIGWVFDIGLLKSISPAWTSMKLITAVTFVLSGITLYFIVRAHEGEFDKAQVVLSITTLTIILLMGILFSSALLKIHTGIEDLFIKEHPGAVKTVTPGRPSIPTTLNFILIALCGIQVMWNPRNLRARLGIIGMIITAIGLLAIVGYIFNAPYLYYFIEGKNSAIALNTAVLFVFLGMGLLCLKER